MPKHKNKYWYDFRISFWFGLIFGVGNIIWYLYLILAYVLNSNRDDDGFFCRRYIQLWGAFAFLSVLLFALVMIVLVIVVIIGEAFF